MMKLYRLKIYPRSSYITPWHSDTLMGSLCWVTKHLHGEQALSDYLELCLGGKHPYVLSGCFPGDLLPRPLAGNCFQRGKALSKEEAMAEYARGKTAKKANYISLDDFNTIISGGQVEIGPRPAHEFQVSVMHNTISRLSDTTSDGGSLFEEPETFSCENYLSLYAAIEDSWIDRFQALLAELARQGFGRRASVGKGDFKVGEAEEFNHFAHVTKPGAKVMLSNYVPAKTDPVEGQYRAFIKYGKLGNEYASLKNPFKKPVLMFEPGSVFWDNSDRKIYGRTFEGISPEKAEIVQFGCALAVPASVEKPDS